MFDAAFTEKVVPALAFVAAYAFAYSVRSVLTRKRSTLEERLKGLSASEDKTDDDIMARPFFDRTFGSIFRAIAGLAGQTTPSRLLATVEDRLARTGNPRNIKAGDFVGRLGLIAPVSGICAWFFLKNFGYGPAKAIALSCVVGALGAYLPWLNLGRAATFRKRAIQRSLPDIMDLLIVSVEAGLAFDMALVRVVEHFRGAVSEEFQRVLKEMQLGKARKDALRDMGVRVDLPELTSLTSAVIQADQLGVGISNVLKMQGDLIREKRQQFVEEQAMKAPVKMLFPLIVFIFPSILIVVLGPAIINIVKALSGI